MVHRYVGFLISIVGVACSSGAREADAGGDSAASSTDATGGPSGEATDGEGASEETTDAGPTCGPGSGNGAQIAAIGFANPGDQRFSSLAVGQGGVLTVVGDVEVSQACESTLDVEVPLQFGGKLDYPKGRQSEIVVAQFDTASGDANLLAGGVIGGDGFQRSAGVAIDGEGIIYIAGVFNGDLALPNKLGDPMDLKFVSGPTLDPDEPPEYQSFIAAYEPTGDLLWHIPLAAQPGEGSAWIEDIAVNTRGEVALVGAAHGEVPVGLGNDCELGDTWSPFIAKMGGGRIRPDGMQWVRCPDSDGDEARALAVDIDEAGMVAATGFFRESMTWRDAQGEALPGGTVEAAGTQDLFVARWDTGGRLRWHERCGSARVQGSSDDDAGQAVLAAPDGRVFVAGTIGEAASCMEDGTDVYSHRTTGLLAARDVSGWTWEQVVQLETDESEIPAAGAALTALAQLPDGGIVVTGAAHGVVAFGGEPRSPRGAVDALVAKLACDGTLVWFHRYGDAEGDAGLTMFGDVALAGDSLHLVGGYTASINKSVPTPEDCEGPGADAMLINLSL